MCFTCLFVSYIYIHPSVDISVYACILYDCICRYIYIWVNMCVYGYLCMHVYYMDVYVGTYIWMNMCVYGYFCGYVRVCILFAYFYYVYI